MPLSGQANCSNTRFFTYSPLEPNYPHTTIIIVVTIITITIITIIVTITHT